MMNDMFKGINGQTSSKRVIGFVLFIVIMIMVLAEQLFNLPINFNVFASLLASATTLIGVGVFEKGISK